MSHIRFLEFIANESPMQNLMSRLADTGGSNLAFVAWIAGILIVVGAVVLATAIYSRRRKAAQASAIADEGEHPTVDGGAT